MRWGDYVKIKFVNRNEKKEYFFTCEPNIAGSGYRETWRKVLAVSLEKK